MTAAVLAGWADRDRVRRWSADRVEEVLATSPAFARTLPTAAVLGMAAVAATVGVLPVTDAELVAAGVVLGLLACLLGSLLDRARAGSDGAVLTTAAQFGAVGLLGAGSGSPAALLLLLGPVLAPALGPGRRDVLAAVLGTTAVLLAPVLLGTSSPVAADLPAALLLGPFAAGAAALTVATCARRARRGAGEIDALREERSALVAQVQARADELDVATRMLAARARTMTSVIDAVTEQSIISTDTDGLIRVWNPGAERMLGLPRVDVVRARSIVEFHLASELEAAAAAAGSATGLAALVAVAERDGSDVRDWTYVATDGRRRTVSVAITPRTGDRGERTGWNFVGTDMTEVRAGERRKDQLVSLISHELRTPLSSILGYLELVLDDGHSLPEEHRGHLHTVERNARRLQRLVGDLLYTAQVEAGRLPLHPGDVDLVALALAAEENARVTAAAAGVELRVDLPEDPLVVPGDAMRLGQACDNLVSNAVKFTPPGGRVTVSLRAGRRRPEGSVDDRGRPTAEPVARLSVADTGVGIPADEQGELFTRFFRASNARRDAVPGVGLGLTITRAIATAHGGTLELVSTEGDGTTVTLTLPR